MSNAQESVKARLQTDLTAAMKARDEVTLSTIRMVREGQLDWPFAEPTSARAIEKQTNMQIERCIAIIPGRRLRS